MGIHCPPPVTGVLQQQSTQTRGRKSLVYSTQNSLSRWPAKVKVFNNFLPRKRKQQRRFQKPESERQEDLNRQKMKLRLKLTSSSKNVKNSLKNMKPIILDHKGMLLSK